MSIRVDSPGTPRTVTSPASFDFDSAVELAQHRIERLQKQWIDNQDERAHALKLYEMARGDWARHIPRMPDEPERKGYKDPIGFNILGYVIEQLSYLYDLPPTRKMEGEEEQEWAQSKLWDFERTLDAAMHAADKQARLTGNALIRLTYKHQPWTALDLDAWARGLTNTSPLEDTERDGVQAFAIPRHRFEVLTDTFDELAPVAIVEWVGSIEVEEVNLTSGRADTVEVPVHHYWDGVVFARLIDWTLEEIAPGVPTVIPHGYGLIPYVSVRNDEMEYEYYCQGVGGHDLYDTVLQLGQLIKELGWAVKTNRGQPWAAGLEEKQRLILSSETVIKVGAQGKFGIEANKANLPGMDAGLERFLQLFAKTCGLPSNTFEVTNTSGSSGVALAMTSRAIEDERLKREKLGSFWEMSAHAITASIYNATRGTSYTGELADLAYNRPEPVYSTDERIKRVQAQHAMELISPVDAIMDLHPGMSEEEAEKRYQRAIQTPESENTETEGSSPPSDPPPDESDDLAE